MAPAISSLEMTRIPRDPQSAQSLLSSPHLPVTRHSHCSTYRRISHAHKRRFRYRQLSDNSTAIVSASAVDGGTPLPYSPTVDQYSSLLPSTDTPATTTTAVSDQTLPESAMPQPQARNPEIGVTAAIIAVCVLAGLAMCTMMGRLAYRRRSSLLRSFRRHRQAEDNLGFVFIEYDNSAWGPPAKNMRKDMPSFETGVQSPGGEEAHIELVTSSPLTPNSIITGVHPLAVEALPVGSRSNPHLPPTKAGSGLCRELVAIVDANRRGTNNAVPTGDFDPCFKICRSATQSRTEVLNALGLAMERDDILMQSTLSSPQLSAAPALHPGEVDGVVEEDTDSTTSDSLSSDSVACRLSTESSGSEEDTHSINMKHDITVSLGPWADADCVEDKKLPLDIYDIPRVVISSSSSVASDAFSSRSNRASGVSLTTIDLGDFPRPPFIGDKLVSTSTSLITEIEVSLGTVISGGLGLAGRRVSSAPQLTV